MVLAGSDLGILMNKYIPVSAMSMIVCSKLYSELCLGWDSYRVECIILEDERRSRAELEP